jgi:Protein of unknown function (DUF3106)
MISRTFKFWLLMAVASLLLPALPARAQAGYRAQAFRAAVAQRKANRKARHTAEAADEAAAKDVRPDDAKPADGEPGASGQRGAPAAKKPGAGKGQPNARSMEGLPPKWIEQLRDRSPEEQQRFMENNERFKSLPAERQAQIRRNLEQWNRLSPEQKNSIFDRERFFESLSPQQRQYVRNNLLPRWQAMSVERRQLLLGRLRVLRDLPPEERSAKLNDPKFMQGLSPDEQQTLRDLNQLRNPLPTQ